MKSYTIYRHVNRINGKSYIGQTCRDPSKRWAKGNGYAKEHQTAFYNAIQKYGWENFDHEILEDGIKTLKESNEREKFWIAHYHTWVYDPECNGYNMTSGGDGSPGRKMSEESKEKLRKEVYCVELDQVFNSLTEASEKTGCQIGKISLCCRGKANTAGGYHWEYLDSELSQQAVQNKEDRYVKKQEYYSSLSMPVYCVVDNKDKFVFSSKSEAAKWWFENYPLALCSPVFYTSTYITKINQSIAGDTIRTGINVRDRIEITNIKWFEGVPE